MIDFERTPKNYLCDKKRKDVFSQLTQFCRDRLVHGWYTLSNPKLYDGQSKTLVLNALG